MPPKNIPLEIDIIIEESLKFDTMKKNRVIKSVQGVKIPILSIKDLLRMKRKAGRENDIRDIQALLHLKGL